MSFRLQLALYILAIIAGAVLVGVCSWLYTDDWLSGVVFGVLALVGFALALLL